jgi:hypothetical protein
MEGTGLMSVAAVGHGKLYPDQIGAVSGSEICKAVIYLTSNIAQDARISLHFKFNDSININ